MVFRYVLARKGWGGATASVGGRYILREIKGKNPNPKFKQVHDIFSVTKGGHKMEA
jgi:hypothetical protein